MTRRPAVAVAVLAPLLLAALASELASESVTLRTYYPAPSGVYTQMITTSNAYLARDGGRVGIGITNPAAKLDVAGTAFLRGAPGATGLYVEGSGDVGIGTTSPAYKLDVAGSARFGGAGSGNAVLGRDGFNNASLELRQSNNAGTPYIDFSNDAGSDYDARLILSGGDLEHRGQGWATFRASNGGFLVDNVGGGRGLFTNNLSVGANPPIPGLHGLAVEGNVRILGSLSKGSGSFIIDHPLDPKNRILRHSFVESPDMKNIYDGIATLGPKGEAEIALPRYFESLNRDYRYQLVAIGKWAPLFVKSEVKSGRFVVASADGAKDAALKVSWQVTGTRQDPFARENPIVVEEEKGPANGFTRGAYIHAAAYGVRPSPPRPMTR